MRASDSTNLHNFAAVAAGTPEATIGFDSERCDAHNHHQFRGVNILPKNPFNER